jgi:transcription antitermination factor NusG
MDWYVLHVRTGSELDVQRQLEGLGYTVAVPREARQIRRGGQWHEELCILMPGYVFLQVRYSPEIYHMLKGVSGAIQLLPKGSPYPLSEREVEWLYSMISCRIRMRPSRVDFSGEKPVVLDGTLKKLEEYIVKFDRHRRRAHVRLPMLGEARDFTLSFRPA